MKLRLDALRQQIDEKVKSDKFGLFVSNEWKRLLNPYTPMDTGNLIRSGEIEPFQIHYKATSGENGEPYSAIVYYNTRGVRFKTIYSPFATDHWDEKAEAAGQKDKLYQAINTALRTNRI